ncbi:MAG: transglutaminase family protein, partial [Campylobacterales bacterium]|nr:transglutaminase family protein [Campylobacterales bacterium]
VKYKAWQPWSALHPTIGVDTPLVFDVVDRWNQRSIGGMTYYVSHPGGRSYDTFPVNSYEAESRRINRFWGFNHTQGSIEEVPAHVVEQTLPSREGETTRKVAEKHAGDKIFVFQELPRSAEYPHTLDLRRKWTGV